MILNGISNKDIARKAGVSTTWVSLVLCGHRRSKRVERVIARVLGKKPQELWPDHNENEAA